MTDITESRHHRAFTGGVLANSQAVRSSEPFLQQGVPCALAGGEFVLDALQLSPYSGGLVFLGPTAAPLPAIDALIGSPEVEAMQACGESMSSWTSSPDEILVLSRRISSVLRTGKTVVVYLDSHLEDGAVPPLAQDSWAFVCSRLSRIMVGLADEPAYVAVHGVEMAQGFFDAVGDVDPPVIGELGCSLAVHQLTSQSFIGGTPVAVVPPTMGASAVVQAVDWFEARRCVS